MRRLLLALIAAGALFGSAAPSFAAGVDPYQIFSRARSVWAQERYPEYLTYMVVVRVNEGGVEKAKHYHLAYDAKSAKIYVNPVSDEERAAPPDPHGMTFHLLPRRKMKVLFDKKVGHPSRAVDYLGVPMISPTYSFGMSAAQYEAGVDPNALVEEIRRQYHDPMPPVKAEQLAQSGGLKTIAVVAGYRRHYTVTLAGIEDVEGRPCYHLLLVPAYKSPLLRLRQLWVDTQNYQTLKMVTDGNFTGNGVPWTITFAQQDGATYIAREDAMAPVGVGRHRYEQASVSFEDVTSVSRPPGNLSGWFLTKENIISEPAAGPQ